MGAGRLWTFCCGGGKFVVLRVPGFGKPMSPDFGDFYGSTGTAWRPEIVAPCTFFGPDRRAVVSMMPIPSYLRNNWKHFMPIAKRACPSSVFCTDG
jgi:hypothetical protein